MATHRRTFLKAATISTGAAAALVGSIRSFIPKARAGESVATKYDKLPVVNGNLERYPPFEKWNGWREMDGDDWKRGGILRHDVKVNDYMLVPTVCNNCEAVCGLTAWVDKETLTVRKYMGNPLHTGSQGRNCAKGYAVLTQMYDPDRIPFPLKRAPGTKRGDGKWVRTTWDEAMATIGGKMREALSKGDEFTKKSIMHHVGRPNESGFTPRVWASLGQDFQNSHTNICSASGRFGSLLWANDDRSSSDWSNARLIFLISSHAADAGHYFQQSARQIAEARKKGAKLVVLDPRLSNSAGMADLWIPCWPGSEAAIQLAIAGRLIKERRYNREFVRRWWNWQDFMASKDTHQLLLEQGFITKLPAGEGFEAFEAFMEDMYGAYTLEWAAEQARVPLSKLETLYEYFLYAGDRVASFHWRATAAGNRGGWMSSSRTGIFLISLLGNYSGVGALGYHHGREIAVAGKGGKSTVGEKPPKVDEWNDLSWPPEWPLASYELSFLLPHLLTDTDWQQKWRDKGLTVPSKIPVYFPRMYNPVWINPDGFRWIEVLRDESKIELAINPSPIWSETNWFMDYILPTGLSGERHDQHSEPTNTEAWVAFRQPVLRAALEKMGWEPKDPARATLEAHMKAGLGEIWEENEFFINLLFHHVDPDGALGIRQYWESRARPGNPVTIAEYYDAAFGTLPGLTKAAKEAAAKKAKDAKTPEEKKLAAFAAQHPCYDMMRDRGAWTEHVDVFNQYEEELEVDEARGVVKTKAMDVFGGAVEYPIKNVKTDPKTQQLYVETPEGRHNVGVVGERGGWEVGFPTPSRKMDFFAGWMKDWGWPEYTIPIYPRTKAQMDKMIHLVSHVHHQYMTEENAFALNPIFRLSYNIHTRGVNSKWLQEISQNHAPLWISMQDARRMGLGRGDPVKVRVVDTLSGKESGYFVAMAMPTEGMAPGVLSCSHHAGRWRVVDKVDISGFEQPLHIMRAGSPQAELKEEGSTQRSLRYTKGIEAFLPTPTKEFGDKGWPFAAVNQDLDNISWDGLSGVWQNATHHPHPDPISGMHCWHQKVLLEKAGPGDRIGDLKVDISATYATYQAWRDELTRPAPGPGGLRRPEHLKRPWVAITRDAYKMKTKA